MDSNVYMCKVECISSGVKCQVEITFFSIILLELMCM